MSKKASPLPRNGRLISAGLTAAAACGLLVNHFLVDSQHVGRLMILCLGPIAFFLGIGGMVEPRIVWSVGKHGKHLPAVYKVIGGVLGTVGLAVTGLLLIFVYRFGPPEPKPSPQRPGPAATAARLRTRADSRRQPDSVVNPEPVAAVDSELLPNANPGRRIVPQDVQYLTYDRPGKRWLLMDEAALKGVRREDRDGVTTLHYVDGTHALLKVIWPDGLEVGDRFTVELQGANSFEVVDLDGADAHARIGVPAGEPFAAVEMHREQDALTFVCNGQRLKPYYASGKRRGDDARAALVSAQLRPAFTIKKGAHASFRNAQIAKP